jgi:O-antigen/teichoic acid export membrane protein
MIKKYSKKMAAAAASPVGEFALRFARTMAFSRILMPDDLGAAVAIFAILVTCESMTDFGLENFVMANSGENRGQAIAAAQWIAVIRATAQAFLIAAFAFHLAWIFGVPGQEENIRWLGVITLLRSFKNWRVVQIQADAQYRPQAIASISSNAGALIAGILVAFWFHDARAMLASLIVEAIIYTIVSHVIISGYRFRIADRETIVSALKYGAPLTINAIGLLFFSQFDRIIVAQLFGLTMLALYALVWTLAIAPTSPLVSAAASFYWPFLRKEQDEQAMRQTVLVVILGQFSFAALYAIGIATLLDVVLPLVFGSHYVVTPEMRAISALIAFLRICRASPNTVLLASSNTGKLTLGNAVAITGIVLGTFFAMWTNRVEMMMLGVLIGDLLSLIILIGFIWGRMPHIVFLKHVIIIAISVISASIIPFFFDNFDLNHRLALAAASTLLVVWQAATLYRERYHEVSTNSMSARVSEVPSQINSG